MKTMSAALKAHYASGSTTIATCWKATLTNGTVVAATSHDADIVYDGVTYQTVAAYNPSTIESGSELNPDNLELEGFLASPAITEEDIHSGVWDYAAIEMFEVNYRDLTMGRNLVRSGTLGEVRAGRSRFTAELRGLIQAYSRRIVRLVTAECTADLGDSRCTINLASHTYTAAVEAVTGNRVIESQSLITTADWFTGGKLTFTSGLNSGRSMEVKQSAGAYITLHEQMPFTIAVGDTFTVHAGCMKRLAEDCIRKFNNVLNFRGFPYLPGSGVYGGPQTKIYTQPEPAPVPVPAPYPSPAPAPAPAPAPGPAPQTPASSVLGIYFEAYYGDDITLVPTTFNTVYVFHAKPNGSPVGGVYTNQGNGSWQFQHYDTVTAARVQTVRGRSQRVLLTLGGANAGFVYDTRTKSNNAIASIKDIIAALGGVDGVDFNNYEARIMASVQNTFTTEMIYIADALKDFYGSSFMVTTPCAPNYPEDQYLCQQMANAGVLDYAAPQFYDWSGFNAAGYIEGRMDTWVGLVGATKAVIGLGASYSNGPSITDCTREWNAVKANHPTIRGMFGWSHRTNQAAGNVWGTTMAGLL